MSRGQFVDNFDGKILLVVIKSLPNLNQKKPIKKSLETALLRNFKAQIHSGPDGS